MLRNAAEGTLAGWAAGGEEDAVTAVGTVLTHKAPQPPSWQTLSPAVPQISRQIIGGDLLGDGGGGLGDGGGGLGDGVGGLGLGDGRGGLGGRGGAGSTVNEPKTPVNSIKWLTESWPPPKT